MKYLKLFETFGSSDKIKFVNGLVIEYVVHRYLHENQVKVRKDREGDYYFDKIGVFIDKFFWVSLESFNLISKSRFREYMIHVPKSSLMNEFSYPLAKAMWKWIEYLRNTPDKKHLLQE
jgi:hypothetical protein